jgi:hypothetical protein
MTEREWRKEAMRAALYAPIYDWDKYHGEDVPCTCVELQCVGGWYRVNIDDEARQEVDDANIYDMFDELARGGGNE